MTTVAIELNDAEIRVADCSGMRTTEPGYAWLDGNDVRVGEDAFLAASVQPRSVHNRYWSELDQSEIRRGGARPVTHADLAYAQLEKLWSTCRGAEEAVFLVPGSMQREQLALLLGIANAAGIPVRGLVDAAVASCHRAFPGVQLQHWDVGLHAASVSVLGQGARVERRDFEAIPRLGLARVREAQIKGIARAFVEQTRFDPLHDAGGEQALQVRLPDFIAALRDRATARIELDHGGVARTAEIRRADLAKPAGELCAALLARAERSAEPVVALVSHRLADLPGFDEAVSRAPNLEVVRLEPEAACCGALARLDQIPKGEAGHRRLLALPFCEGKGEGEPEATEPEPTGAGERPTHVVHGGVAHPLRADRFELGAAEPGGPGLAIPGAALRHGAIVRDADGFAYEASGPDAAFLNGAPVEGRARLHAGDELRLGESGAPLLLVAVREARGA